MQVIRLLLPLMLMATPAFAQVSTTTASEASETIELPKLWSKFISAEVDEMPPFFRLDPAIDEAKATCKDQMVMREASASGGTEAPNCRVQRRAYEREKNKKKRNETRFLELRDKWMQCVDYNQDLAERRIRFCRRAVKRKGAVLPPGQDVNDPIENFIPMGIGGSKGRGVILTCYKESVEYMRAKVADLGSKYDAINRGIEDIYDPSKAGSPANQIAELKNEFDRVKGTLRRLENAANQPPPKAPDAKGAFNVLRFSMSFRVFSDSAREGDPAYTLDAGLEFDVALADDYEMYVRIGYAGGIAQNPNGGGIVQAPTLQFRFPIADSKKNELFFWGAIEGFAVLHQRDFRISDEILVGLGGVLGLEWWMFYAQAGLGGANHGTREDGTAGAALVWSVAAGLTVPFDAFGRDDRFEAQKKLTARREAERNK